MIHSFHVFMFLCLFDLTGDCRWKLALTPSVLAEMRFFSSGIAAGSSTSKLMSYFAIFYRGAVPVSVIATLQFPGNIFSVFCSLSLFKQNKQREETAQAPGRFKYIQIYIQVFWSTLRQNSTEGKALYSLQHNDMSICGTSTPIQEVWISSQFKCLVFYPLGLTQ